MGLLLGYVVSFPHAGDPQLEPRGSWELEKIFEAKVLTKRLDELREG